MGARFTTCPVTPLQPTGKHPAAATPTFLSTMSITKKKLMKKIVKQKKSSSKKNWARLYGIKQGVGAVTKAAFPKKRRPNGGSAKKCGFMSRHALNAMHPFHLALPRAVGGYTVIRTTDIINTTQEAILFGTFKGPGAEFSETTWLDAIAVRNTNGGATLPINDATTGGNAYFHTSTALAATALNGARMVPAAMTVQIMNGDSLQNADGIAYIGRSKTVLDLMGDTRSWNDLMKELVSYSAPRLCSGGKLALRGVQINAIPNNLSVLSDFVPRRLITEGQHVWTEATYSLDFEGFGPIFVYNPDKMALKYLVTIEWRMRFDPLNPAYAGHVVHPPASESTWSKVIADAEAMGNGVHDIADVTADIGMTAAAALPFLL